jgi:ABC-type multidrug transport system fused ATPase/permease subunit
MFNLGESLYPEKNLEEYQRKCGANKKLTISCFINIRMFALAGVLAVLGAALAFVGPLVIKQIISLLKAPKAAGNVEKILAYKQVALWIGMYFLRIFVNEYADRLMFIEATKAEQILNIEVLRKLARLSPIYKRSSLLNYLINDIKLVFSFIKSCAAIFNACSTLLLVQLFLLFEVGLIALVLMVVFFLVGLAQVYLLKIIFGM